MTGHSPVQPSDFLIVGAGVIGLSLAWKLGQAGASVTVVDRGPIPRTTEEPEPGQASWNAAGMLSPFTLPAAAAPEAGSSILVDLGVRSLRLYPSFLESLCSHSGSSITMEGCGSLRMANTASGRDQLQLLQNAARSKGVPMEWADGNQLESIEPLLKPRPEFPATRWQGLLSTDERYVNPRKLIPALASAARAAGCKLIQNSRCAAILTADHTDRVLGVRTPRRELAADNVVLCAGAWCGGIAASLSVLVPVVPLRGEILVVRSQAPLRHTLFMPQGILSPRGHGRILVGSTEDEDGFYPGPTIEGRRRLLSFAQSMIPSLRDEDVEESWWGFRPDPRDELPLFGPAAGWENLHICTGHCRKGILLAPVTADIMSDWLLNRVLPPEPSLWANRFRYP